MVINERPVWIIRNYIRFWEVWGHTWTDVTKFIERDDEEAGKEEKLSLRK